MDVKAAGAPEKGNFLAWRGGKKSARTTRTVKKGGPTLILWARKTDLRTDEKIGHEKKPRKGGALLSSGGGGKKRHFERKEQGKSTLPKHLTNKKADLHIGKKKKGGIEPKRKKILESVGSFAEKKRKNEPSYEGGVIKPTPQEEEVGPRRRQGKKEKGKPPTKGKREGREPKRKKNCPSRVDKESTRNPLNR